jgi:hypothetical protein
VGGTMLFALLSHAQVMHEAGDAGRDATKG